LVALTADLPLSGCSCYEIIPEEVSATDHPSRSRRAADPAEAAGADARHPQPSLNDHGQQVMSFGTAQLLPEWASVHALKAEAGVSPNG
jgi:hypothetical protein